MLARPPVRLFLVSSTVLFAELLLIRWIPSNVIYVGFFRNFLLMASFLGIGIGILWGRNPNRITLPIFWTAPAGRHRPRHDWPGEHPAAVTGRDLLRPQRELDRGRRQLPRPARARGARRAAHGGSGDPARRPAQVDAAAAGVHVGHRRVDGGHRRLHGALRARDGADRLVPGPRRAAPAGRPGRRDHAGVDHHGRDVHGGRPRPRRRREAQPELVALLPHRPVRGRRRQCDRRQRHPPPGDVARRPRARRADVRPDLRLVPGPHLRQRSHCRGRVRDRCRRRAGEGRETRRRRRDRPGDPADRS